MKLAEFGFHTPFHQPLQSSLTWILSGFFAGLCASSDLITSFISVDSFMHVLIQQIFIEHLSMLGIILSQNMVVNR